MKQHAMGTTVIRSLSIAPSAPAPVAEAHEAFTALGDRLTETETKLAEARTAAKVEVETAKRTAAAARLARSKPSTDPAKVEAGYARKIADLEAEVVVLTEQVDQAGDALTDAIVEHRDGWLPELQAAEAEATEKLEKALALTREALRELGVARTAAVWLESFDATRAKHEAIWGFIPRPVQVDLGRHIFSFDSITAAEPILNIVALALKPIEKPEPRKLVVARESSRTNATVRPVRPGALRPVHGPGR